jgi:hypothetical protein
MNTDSMITAIVAAIDSELSRYAAQNPEEQIAESEATGASLRIFLDRSPELTEYINTHAKVLVIPERTARILFAIGFGLGFRTRGSLDEAETMSLLTEDEDREGLKFLLTSRPLEDFGPDESPS